MKHVVHGCDAGRVEAQRLVERRRYLLGRKGDIHRMWGSLRGRETGGRGAAVTQAVRREDPTVKIAVTKGVRSALETCAPWS